MRTIGGPMPLPMGRPPAIVLELPGVRQVNAATLERLPESFGCWVGFVVRWAGRCARRQRGQLRSVTIFVALLSLLTEQDTQRFDAAHGRESA